MPWDLGIRKTKEILFQNRFLSAVEAHELGFVNQVVPRAELEAYTQSLAERIAETDPFLTRMIKFSANQAQDAMGFRTAVQGALSTYMVIQQSGVSEKEKDYVLAARSIGLSDTRIVFRHMLPNILAPLLIQATLAMAFAVLLEAGLSFLGLGAQPPEPSWGSMLNASRTYLREAPWYGIFPGIALSLLLLGLNFLADAVSDALDPHQKNLI